MLFVKWWLVFHLHRRPTCYNGVHSFVLNFALILSFLRNPAVHTNTQFPPPFVAPLVFSSQAIKPNSTGVVRKLGF